MNGKPPKTLPEWIAYLHAARAVPKDSPDYGDAQEAVRFALQRIQRLNTVANAADQGAAEQGKAVSPTTALGVGLMQGLGAGTGEPIAGLISALQGQGFGAGAAQYRQGLENVGAQHPTATAGGDVAGLALGSAVPVGQGVGAGTAIARTIPSTRANALARFLTGVGHTDVTPGLTMGALQGFSAGGEDPGDINARLSRGAVGAAAGAAGQALFGGLGALRVPRWVGTVKREIRQAVPKGTPPEMVEQMTEQSIRTGLKAQGYPPEAQERVLAAWRAGKTEAPPPPPPPMPPIQRPGETISQVAPKGFEVRGPRATPPEGPYPPSIAEMQGFRTGPRGVGGHSYSGTYPAGTAANVPGRPNFSPSGGPGPQAQQLAQLKVLAEMPAAQFEEVAGMFPQEIIAQLRTIRAQFGLGQ